MDIKMRKTMFPQPDFARKEWMNLNGPWEFSLETASFDRTIEIPYSWGSPLSGIPDSVNGKGYYRRYASWNPEGERIFLCFGAVDYSCTVMVNGVNIGEHRGGYARFEFDITGVWNRGSQNEIRVEAEDLAEASQTYGKQEYGDARGIWQTVWLEARPNSYIDRFFVKTTLDGTVTYEIKTRGGNGARLTAEFDGETAEGVVENEKATLTLCVANPRLWTPEEPNLYFGSICLEQSGQKDEVSTYFGIREIGTGKFGENRLNYITLNGKPYYINGVLDQSFNPLGYFTLPSDEDCREEILRLKRIGINMARIHIKAEEPLKLYYADLLGLLIMEDIPCFYGNPKQETRIQFEREMEEQICRDRNHPSVFYWVLFNETWGLYTKWTDSEGEHREYRPETAEWVTECYKKAKNLDPTRLVEDNSVCQRDHTVTDVNTWHFYINGYEEVKRGVEDFCNGAYPGSGWNYKEGYTMEDVPCMNSECGNMWGIKGNAGESDISWQYKYMLNEFRLHDRLCGFIFTEFHDVVDEFNGYYKIDNGDKEFGYEAFGTTLKDLHSQDYLGADFAPMTTVKPDSTVTVPMFGSSFSEDYHGRMLDVFWQFEVNDIFDGGSSVVVESGVYQVEWKNYGTFSAGEISIQIPDMHGVAALKWQLCDDSNVIMQNYILFDIEGQEEDVLSLEVSDFEAHGFTHAFKAQGGEKLCGLGNGSFSARVKCGDIPYFCEADGLRVILEISTREPMSHDYPVDKKPERTAWNGKEGYRCDPGENANSYTQTDERTCSGEVEVLLDGISCGKYHLADCPADSRGALSHHYQAVSDLLDEAGSYGFLLNVRIPSRILLKLKEKEEFIFTLKTQSGNGLALYGRKSGRYGTGIVFMAE